MNGRVCVVTGGNAGIGRATAAELARRGATVVLICRSRERGEEAQRAHLVIHVLINNAAVFLPKREVTEDGIEKTFATNYLSHFLLTHLFLGALKAGAPSRIVNVDDAGGQP